MPATRHHSPMNIGSKGSPMIGVDGAMTCAKAKTMLRPTRIVMAVGMTFLSLDPVIMDTLG